MIIVIKGDSSNKDMNSLMTMLLEKDCRVDQGHAGQVEVWEVSPDERAPDPDFLRKIPCVEGVLGGDIKHPLVSELEFWHDDLESLLLKKSRVDSRRLTKDADGDYVSYQQPGFVSAAGRPFHIIAGPCSFTPEDDLNSLALALKQAGATGLRGGSFKPRTSPYSYRGMGVSGLKKLSDAGKKAGMPTVSEIMAPEQLSAFIDVDILQVGARNMQNFSLLKALSQQEKPVLLKRGMGNTIEEFLNSAEYLAAGGNEKIILCERGSVSFDPGCKIAFNLNNIPILKSKTKLPVIADPSHGTARADLVMPMAMAAAAAGADGLMVEVHPDPSRALSDAGQALTVKEFISLAKAVRKIVETME